MKLYSEWLPHTLGLHNNNDKNIHGPPLIIDPQHVWYIQRSPQATILPQNSRLWWLWSTPSSLQEYPLLSTCCWVPPWPLSQPPLWQRRRQWTVLVWAQYLKEGCAMIFWGLCTEFPGTFQFLLVWLREATPGMLNYHLPKLEQLSPLRFMQAVILCYLTIGRRLLSCPTVPLFVHKNSVVL